MRGLPRAGGGDVKAELRKRIWDLLMQRGVARFPLPVHGRIPNFVGAELAARRLAELGEYERAELVFCNPDSPQRPVREMVLRDGKTLVMATPRLRKGLLVLEPGRIADDPDRIVYCDGLDMDDQVVKIRVPGIDTVKTPAPLPPLLVVFREDIQGFVP